MKFIELIEKLGKECREREKNGSPIEDFKNYTIEDILDVRYGIRYQKKEEIIIERKVKLHFDDSLSLEYRKFGKVLEFLKVNINSPAMIEHYGKFEVIECSVFGRDILYKGGEGEDAGKVIGDFLGTNPF